jgi:hypothetical protein
VLARLEGANSDCHDRQNEQEQDGAGATASGT